MLGIRVLFVLLVLAAAFAAPARAADSAPNVVVVMTDDQTLADMQAMPRTVRLLGGEGTTFSRSHVSYPICCPSRATYLTGQYAHNHGVLENSWPLGGVTALDATETLPVWLRRSGYETIHIGKYLNGYGLNRPADVPPGWSDWHATVDKSTYQMWGFTLSDNGVPTTYGTFEDEDPALYQTDVLRDKALSAIRAHAGTGKRPFFLSVMFVAPHGEVEHPGLPTGPYLRPAPRHEGRLLRMPLPRTAAFDELDVSDKPAHIRRLSRISQKSQGRILADLQARRESLMAVDEAVEAIVEELRRTGELDSTYVLFTSDNGFLQGEHRVTKGKYLPYDASTHVPLLVRGPGIPAGLVSDELVSNIDLAPTILDAAGASARVELDGRSVLPFASAPWRRSPRVILHEGLVAGDNDRDGARPGSMVELGEYRAIRTTRFLYVRWVRGGEELYDLFRDPLELRSLHADPAFAGVRRLLGRQLDDLIACQGAECATRSPASLPAAARRAARLQKARARPRA